MLNNVNVQEERAHKDLMQLKRQFENPDATYRPRRSGS